MVCVREKYESQYQEICKLWLVGGFFVGPLSRKTWYKLGESIVSS